MVREAGQLDRARKKALSVRLRTLMEAQGLSVSDVARRMESELPGERFNPVNLSHYKAARSLPRPRYLHALSRALGVKPQDLLPPASALDMESLEPDVVDDTKVPAFRIEDLSDGKALLQINQALPWAQVLRILEALKGEHDAPLRLDAGKAATEP